MFDVRDHIKKLLLLVPAGCVVLAAGITISGYEAQPVRAKEKSIPEFQLVKEETESTTSLFDNMETVTLPEVKVLECKVDEASLDGDSYHAKTTGLGAKKPDAAMETEAFSEAIKHITNMAENDEATKKLVERRVKKLLSQYIENMGKIQKIQYDIEWKTKEKDTQN